MSPTPRETNNNIIFFCRDNREGTEQHQCRFTKLYFKSNSHSLYKQTFDPLQSTCSKRTLTLLDLVQLLLPLRLHPKQWWRTPDVIARTSFFINTKYLLLCLLCAKLIKALNAELFPYDLLLKSNVSHFKQSGTVLVPHKTQGMHYFNTWSKLYK